MSCAMNVGSVFDLNSLLKVSNQSPKLRLNVFFGNRSMAIELMVKRHLLLKIALLEVVGFLLELLE